MGNHGKSYKYWFKVTPIVNVEFAALSLSTPNSIYRQWSSSSTFTFSSSNKHSSCKAGEIDSTKHYRITKQGSQFYQNSNSRCSIIVDKWSLVAECDPPCKTRLTLSKRTWTAKIANSHRALLNSAVLQLLTFTKSAFLRSRIYPSIGLRHCAIN